MQPMSHPSATTTSVMIFVTTNLWLKQNKSSYPMFNAEIMLKRLILLHARKATYALPTIASMLKQKLAFCPSSSIELLNADKVESLHCFLGAKSTKCPVIKKLSWANLLELGMYSEMIRYCYKR